jgi:Flp pilus assembly protein TadD
VLLPVENEAGDSSQVYVGSGITYGVARRLERLGSLSIRFGARAEWPTSAAVDSDPLRPLGNAAMLRIVLARAADSVEVHASIADSATRTVRSVLDRRFAASEVPEIESQVATAVTGALHRVGVPFAVRHDDRPVDAEAYRLTTLGYHQLITLGDDAAALRSFVRATELDPFYARAWAGLASVWGVRTGANQLPFEEGYDRTAAAAARALALDSTQGSALASLGGVTALRARNLEAGMPLIRRAMAYEPSNPEVFVIVSFLHRYTHRWNDARDAIRVARQLDPLTLHYRNNEATVELCAGRPQAAEMVYRDALEQSPANDELRAGLVRALALQRRFDEALDVWRGSVSASTPPEVAQALAEARGRDGYFSAVHADGALRLASYRRSTGTRPVSLLRMVHLQFQAGDSAAGFASLETGVRERAEWIFRLPCFASVDEVRGTPHYAALVERIGALPLR